ncbi:MAG: hypothetical protein WC849_01110 [Candidatus Paceibacterota bacterium]
MKKYITAIVYIFGLITIAFLANIGLMVEDDYYNNYLVLIISLSIFETLFPLAIYFEWRKDNSFRVAIGSLINYNADILSVSFGKERIEIVVKKIPRKFKGKTIKRSDEIQNYSVYYGVNNNILITF